MQYGFGIDLGGTTVKMALFDREGDPRYKWEISTDTRDGGSRILNDIAESCLKWLDTYGIDKKDVLGIGIGVPGPVTAKGVVNRCVNLGWGRFNIHEELGKRTGLPVKAGNDANVAALGEAWKGGGKGFENMVMVTLGTGVGGGLIVDGHILHGVHGAGGEIGHMTLNRLETEQCTCGKYGCVEQYCSATGVVRLARRAMASFNGETSLDPEDLSSKAIFDAAAQGDVLAKKVLDQFFDLLGEALANVCATVDPEAIVLGGGVSKAGEPLLEGVRKSFAKYAFHANSGTVFTLATLGNDAGVYGAFKMMLDEFGK